MKIRICSDLHCEFFPPERHKKHLEYAVPELDTDIDTTLILAGDICNYSRKSSYESPLSLLAPRFKNVIIIIGNHEWYSGYFKDSQHNFFRYIQQYPNIHYLDRSSIIIDDVIFIGATLWTNYDNNNPLAKQVSEQFMNDYYQIRNNDGTHTTADTFYNEHKKDLKFLLSESKKYKDMKKVIITHHGPSELSIHEKYEGSGLSNFSFMSELSKEIEKINAPIWCHGHTHEKIDYNLFNTRVIANPLGYPRSDGTYENTEYNRQLVLNI